MLSRKPPKSEGASDLIEVHVFLWIVRFPLRMVKLTQGETNPCPHAHPWLFQGKSNDVPALSSGGCKLDTGSWQLVKVFRGICMATYGFGMLDDTVSLTIVGHFSDRLSVVSIRTEPHNWYTTERVQSSAVWYQGLAPEASFLDIIPKLSLS